MQNKKPQFCFVFSRKNLILIFCFFIFDFLLLHFFHQYSKKQQQQQILAKSESFSRLYLCDAKLIP